MRETLDALLCPHELALLSCSGAKNSNDRDRAIDFPWYCGVVERQGIACRMATAYDLLEYTTPVFGDYCNCFQYVQIREQIKPPKPA